MLSKKTTLLIALIIAVASAQSLVFDLKGLKYTPASDFWTVQVPVTGGSGQYTYQFQLPTGWKSDGSKILIPASSIGRCDCQFAVRTRVKDTVKGDILQRSLVFKPVLSGTTYSLEVTDREYFFGTSSLSTYSQQSTSVSGLDVLNKLGSLVGNVGTLNVGVNNLGSTNLLGGLNNFNTVGSLNLNTGSLGLNSGLLGVNTGINTGINTGLNLGGLTGGLVGGINLGTSGSFGSTTTTTSVTNIFSSLPTIIQLQKYIAAGDIVEIIQTIQLVVDSNIRCEAKASYLADFLGRISAAIEVKKVTLTQLKEIVTVAIAQVQKLTLQIETIKGQQALLKIEQLKIELDQLVIKLKAAYDEYNNFISNTSTFEAEILVLEKEINEINIRYNEIVGKIDSWRQSIKSIDLEIAQYEQKIRLLKERRTTIQTDITSGEVFIKERDVRITKIRESIAAIKIKITSMTSQKEALKKVYLDLEVKVDAAKVAYQSAQTKFSQFEQQIVSITVEIERYQKQTSELEVKQVTQSIENLQSAIKEVKASIDFVQFKCFNAPDIKFTPITQCYQIPQTQWFNYIGQSYTNLAEQIRLKIAQSFQNQVVEISTINIFSDIWKQTYGSSFQNDILLKAQNYKTDLSFGFSSDFSCSSGFANVETKSGVIQSITANSIVIKGDDGREYTLRLGSCSRLEGAGTDFVPKVGNNILFKGVRTTSAFNLHTCTCY